MQDVAGPEGDHDVVGEANGRTKELPGRPRLRRVGKAIDVWPSRAYNCENACKGKREDRRQSFVVFNARED